MARKLLNCSAVLALSITLAYIPATAQQTKERRSDNPSVLGEQNEAARQRQRETDNIAAIASVLSSIDRRQADEDQRRAAEEPKNWGQRLWQSLWNPAVSNWALAFFAAIAAFIGVRTLKAIRLDVRQTAKAATAAQKSAEATADALSTQREIERAYIAMSHKDILFLEFSQITPKRPTVDHENPDCIDFVIEIRNFGRTPGDILGGYSGYIFQPGHDGPDLRNVGPMTGGNGHLPPAFLVPHPEGMLDFAATIRLGKEALRRLRSEDPDNDAKVLWIVGEVDYRDRFHKIHRGGYARIFSKDARNFVIDPSVKDLNYDRPLTPAEIKQRAYKAD
jgi:hypothetical protein